MKNALIGLVAVVGVALMPAVASADHRGFDRGDFHGGRSHSSFDFSVGFNFGNFGYRDYGPYRPVYRPYCPPPVVYAPVPVVYAPPPPVIVYPAAPVVVQPAPVVVTPAPCSGYYYTSSTYYYGR